MFHYPKMEKNIALVCFCSLKRRFLDREIEKTEYDWLQRLPYYHVSESITRSCANFSIHAFYSVVGVVASVVSLDDTSAAVEAASLVVGGGL
jgi:hypothetical protein